MVSAMKIVSVDPTDIERPQAGKTDYAGKLKNEKLGFTILLLAPSGRVRESAI